MSDTFNHIHLNCMAAKQGYLHACTLCSFKSSTNQEVVTRVWTEAKVRQGSITEEHVQCKSKNNYSKSQLFLLKNLCILSGACERYFLSLLEDHRRSMKGVKEKHRIQQR